MAVDSPKRSSSMLRVPLKQLVLIALTLQNSISILFMFYSRTMPLVDGHRYFASTAVLLSEVIKLPFCLSMALYDIASNPRTPDTSTAAALFGELAKAVFTGDSWKVAFPAMLYTFQSSLQYVAISNLDAATFQVTSQLKILTTAMFSVMLLGRTLTSRQWSSLFLLMLGVATVHIPSSTSSQVLSINDLRRRDTGHQGLEGTGAGSRLSKRSATYEGIREDYAALNPEANPSLGLTTLGMACVLSGFAGVYFEKVLKQPKTEYGSSVWIRNVQLSFYSIWPALFIGVIFMDGEHITKTGFFTGYNWAVWSTVLIQAVGGVLVAFVVKLADNITKNFATSIAIVVSFLVSVALFNFEITSFFIVGTAVVISATYLYTNQPETESANPPQLKIPEPDEKSEPSYFDIDTVATTAKSPLRGEAVSTSRPNTPSLERIPRKVKSSDLMKTWKREQ